MTFFEMYGGYAADIAREAVCSSLQERLAKLGPDNAERFHKSFAEPMAKAAKVASWRELPTDKLHGLHDLVMRTPLSSDVPEKAAS